MKKPLLLVLLMTALLLSCALLASCAPEKGVSYTVTFVTSEGSEVPSQTLAAGSAVFEPQAPVKENAVFDGWYKEEACTEAWDFAKDTVSEDITLYAKWAPAAYVTIADGEGKLVLIRKPVKLTDNDGNGTVSVAEALFTAHEAYYTGGAAAGYATTTTQWGLGINKLWGDTSGNYGYYINNAMAWSLGDEVKAGDYLYAYVFSDPVGWTDMFSYFDVPTATINAGGTVTLTLTYMDFDLDWNPAPAPAVGAAVTVNGEASSYVTGAQGEVVLTFAQAGTYVISATSDTLVLVPPVCVVKVK